MSGEFSMDGGEEMIHLTAGNYVVVFEGQWGREEQKLIVIE